MDELTIDTISGRFRGREREGTLFFGGLPFAAPPVGALRFHPPQPFPAKAGVRDARRVGRAAPQRPGGGLTSNRPIPFDEDCLFLNITTPACDAARRPVMVWIHGGDFRTGLGGIPWYAGTRFANSANIVVVTVNYRLGALGFTALGSLGAELKDAGNLGLLDQLAALDWVSKNIERFGGDPGCVTLAGESAGAFSVGALLASKRAEGLFQRAILESGAGHSCLEASAAEVVARRFCEILAIENAADLARPSVEAILDAQQQIDAEFYPRGTQQPLGGSIAPFYPVIDGRTLSERPIDAIRKGASAGIPVLIGTNAHEATLWLDGDFAPARLEATAKHFGSAHLAAVYREALPGASERALQVAMSTDNGFRIPALRLAEARANAPTPTFVYRFGWKSRAFGGRLGATHALEIPFVFDNLDKAGVDAFLGEGPLPQELASKMHAAWGAFIRSGDPSCEAVGDWPAYTAGERASMEFGETTGVLQDPDAPFRAAWDGLL